MIISKLQKLKKILDNTRLNGYIVPSTDEYLSEYTPLYAKRLEYITGFTGSNGLVFLFDNTALFFTDGRYISQAQKELEDTYFQVFDLKTLSKDFPWSNYVNNTHNIVLGYDPKLFTSSRINTIQQSLSNINNITLQSEQKNLIDDIWENQPLKPNSTIYNYELKYSGCDYQEKIKACRDFIATHKATALVLTDPSSNCWLLNIRANDVDFNPIVLGVSIITNTEIYLFTDTIRKNQKPLDKKFTILPIDQFANKILEISGKILFDHDQCSEYIANIIISNSQHNANIKNPCFLWKSCKNNTEIQSIKDIHIEDAVAVCEVLAFINNNQNKASLTEYDIVQKLISLRSQSNRYVFDSFGTICGYQENSAIIHYQPKKKLSKCLDGSGILLIDSGGQYLGGTTDVTRTIAIGIPNLKHKKYYTKVLKGHIALGQAIFPQNIKCAHIDSFARQYLWQSGDDYPHGTGHGVGNFLNVHETPPNISLQSWNIELKKGMVLSNEPGYYNTIDGFGVRIENMMQVIDSKHSGFLSFEMLTLIPYCKELIDWYMITANEMQYLTSYYQKIRHYIFPLLSDEAKYWIKKQIKI